MAFGDEAQAEAVEVEGLERVNPEISAASCFRATRRAIRWRCCNARSVTAGRRSGPGKVAPVAAEIRAETKQTLSLGEDRMVVGSI